MKAGFAHANITPAVDDQPRGSYRPRVMVGVHDPLLAGACVIDDGKTPVVLVGIDAGVIMRDTFLAACKQIQRDTGIPQSNVIVSASHTHTGGASLSTFAARADPAYAPIVARGIASAVTQAWNNRAEASLGASSGEVTGIHFNRRFHMRDGRQATHPGKMNADIVDVAGPVDSKINILAFRNPAGELVGAVVNFGCHSTVTEEHNEYSADYAYYLREHLQRALGPIEIVFLLGACGDVTQIDNRAPEPEKGHAHADKMGTTLASAAAGALREVSFRNDVTVGVVNKTVAIPIRAQDMSEPPTLGLGSGDFWEPIFARERELVAQMREKTPLVDCHVTAIKIGDLAIVTSGAELFVQPALDIQRASPFKKTWTVTLANEYVGYVPTANAHFAGGYEPRMARSSYLAPQAAQKIVETSLTALRGVHDAG